jgi:uncharacterized membrane protein YeiH
LSAYLVASLAATASTLASAAASIASTATTAAPSGLAGVVESGVPQAIASVLPSSVTTTMPITASTITIPAVLEVSAAFAGALAGSLVGVERKFDIVGIATLAIVAGLGGGIIRDILLQDYGIYALQNPRMLIAVLLAAVVGFFFAGAATKVRPALFLIDAISLGLFAVIGSDKALLAGLTFIPAILLGSITSVGGGVLRDLLTGEIPPQVLRPGGFYATASVTGAVLYVTLVGWLNIVKPVAMIAVILVVLALRLLSEWLGWLSPVPIDLTPSVASVPRRTMGMLSQMFGPSPNAETRGSSHAAEGSAAEHDNVEPGIGPEE